MKKTILAVTTLALLMGATSAFAAKTALGFYDSAAPIGIRTWLSDKMGLDLGIGFNNQSISNGGQSTSGFTFDAGLPLVMKSWDKVKVNVRPGVQFGSQDVPTGLTTKEKVTGFQVSGDIEAEVMLMDNVSVSTHMGLAYTSQKSDASGSPTLSTIGLTGVNFFGAGVHIYLW